MLKKGVVDIWHGEIAENEQYNDYFYSFLDPEEKAMAGSMKRPQARSRFLEVRARLRLKLAEYLGQQPSSIAIKRNEYGKPYLAEQMEFNFNLSHSGRQLLLAVTNGCQVGVDIEMIRPRPGFEGLVKKCFAEQEQQYWHSLSEQNKITAFYRFWTAKEAFVKAVGRGIALGLNKVELASGQPLRLVSIPEQYGSVAVWSLCAIDLSESVSAAACLNSGRAGSYCLKPWAGIVP